MKSRILVCLTIALAAPLAGCSKEQDGTPRKARVLCTTFPIYLFARNVAAGTDALQIELMLPADMGCPHDYLLTQQDMQRIADADVLLINGLGLEEFLGAPLKKAKPKAEPIDSSRGISDLIPLGGEPGGREGTDREEKAHLHGGANPHLFASPRMAAKVVRNIAAELSRVDPNGAALYRKNGDSYAARLEKLADEFAEEAKHFRSRRIVTEHAVFGYLARDAGLEIAAVVEETPGQEPSAAEMLRLVKLIRDSGAAAVFTEPQYPAKVARRIAQEAAVPVGVLDPVASGPANAPLDYYEKVMRANLDTLRRTLGAR